MDTGLSKECSLHHCLERAGSLRATGWPVVPSLKRCGTWWAGRVVPHHHCRLDAAALKRDPPLVQLQAVYNYPHVFLVLPPREVPSEQGPGVGMPAAAPTLHVWDLNHFLSSPIHTLSKLLLWSWGGRMPASATGISREMPA